MKNYYLTTVCILVVVYAFFSSCSNETVQKDSKQIIELTGDNIDVSRAKSIAEQNGVEDTQIYQWKNHIVFYSYINEVDKFTGKLKNNFPKSRVKIYEKPFYNFSKSERCADTAVAADWKHIILTANLVEDEKMQQEYLNYHNTQFTEWPEIAQGFCNADFQQLLVYKNGRQLMLVISIPADKTLDELNPKTTENNPRVDDWNRIMGKYQEGIEGTAPGEKWVFLDKVAI